MWNNWAPGLVHLLYTKFLLFQYHWRWLGYQYGLDLLFTLRNKYVVWFFCLYFFVKKQRFKSLDIYIPSLQNLLLSVVVNFCLCALIIIDYSFCFCYQTVHWCIYSLAKLIHEIVQPACKPGGEGGEGKICIEFKQSTEFFRWFQVQAVPLSRHVLLIIPEWKVFDVCGKCESM